MFKINDLREKDNWTITDVQSLIREQVEESHFIEFKSGIGVNQRDELKREIRRWVSSFQNSSGGLLFLGIGAKQNKPNLPDRIEGVDNRLFDKNGPSKWIEDVIKNGIFPPLSPFPLIFPSIADPSDINKSIIIIKVHETSAVLHKIELEDKYYRRYNFQTVPMDDWEIRAILFGRIPQPSLIIDSQPTEIQGSPIFSSEKGAIDTCSIPNFQIAINNVGAGLAKNIQLILVYPLHVELSTPRIPLMEILSKNSYQDKPGIFFKIINIIPDSLEHYFAHTKPISCIKLYLKNEVLHPIDSLNIHFDLKIHCRYGSSKQNINIGAIIMAELMRPKFYDITLELYRGQIGGGWETVGSSQLKIVQCLENKIPVGFEPDFP